MNGMGFVGMGTIKSGNILDELSNCWLLKKESTA
jgi:hypothetical protein